ncbi:hypothetical protein FRX31_018191, partial [Thalictrum thalictroides]
MVKRKRSSVPNLDIYPEYYTSELRRSLQKRSRQHRRDRRLDVDEYENVFHSSNSDSDSDQSINGEAFDSSENQDGDVVT